jgi:hypothetical protein
MRAACTFLAGASALVASLADASTLTPPVLPLIVRNPYLSTWLGNARDVPWKKWPMFWTGQEVSQELVFATACAFYEELDTDVALHRLDSVYLRLYLHRTPYIPCWADRTIL